jgi:DNA-binding MarR family transcriptional regulator/GNAT superfamily N-acetyltransferase
LHKTGIDVEQTIAAADRARRFSRFWTREIGLLHEGLLDTRHSLTEARVIYELAQVPETTASELARALALDPGHLSRVLSSLQAAHLISRKRSPADGRAQLVSLAAAGRRAYAELDRRSSQQASELLKRLLPSDQMQLLDAMATIESLLGEQKAALPLVIRPPLPGEYGWVIQRHGALYAREYGFDTSFEALVARIVADYLEHADSPRQRCWIAALDGRPVGSVFCVDGGDGVAKLRLLIVEPAARGLRIGSHLVEECIRFARAVGYGELKLWTQRELAAARRIYERCGFELVSADRPKKVFGTRQVSETWRLVL